MAKTIKFHPGPFLISRLRIFIFLLSLGIPVLATFSGCTNRPVQSTASVRNQLETLLQLHSYEFLYREILYLGERQTVLGIIPTRDRQFLFRVDFRVSAGVDLSRGYELVPVSGRQGFYLLELPQPEILLVDALEDTIYQYVNQTFGGQLRITELGDLLTLARDSITQDSLDRGILQRARTEAEVLIRSLFHSLGIGEVEFRWRTHG